jgi:phosphatidylserine/phosphatidylglycerophosphate/cardiolipin synthase-like enzyme
MRASLTKDGLTVRVIAGTTSVIVGIDLQKDKRKGCLGFTIRRTDLGAVGQAAPAGAPIALPNMLKFPSDAAPGPITTDRAPLQKFRWGDYTTAPAHRYRYQVVPRFGKPAQLQPAAIADGDGVSVDVTTEDPKSHDTSVSFNRAAAASHAFEVEFPNITSEELLLGQTADAQKARTWLSRGLEEACLAFLAQATNNTFALHAAVYEFQKPNLLAALAAARQRGADVQVVFHARQKEKKGKPDPSDTDKADNEDAIKKAGIGAFCTPRAADPQGAIMHDKFVVLLQKQGAALTPIGVWTGSMNWTDGGVYGQLNVGHAVYDAAVAAQYEQLFQLLRQDKAAADQKKALKALTPVPKTLPPGHGILPIFSPQSATDMLTLYAGICRDATCLMVTAPFELYKDILDALLKRPAGTVHYLLIDKSSALGAPEEVKVQEGDPRNTIAVATTLKSPLHDFQGKLLENPESFLHQGIHIHSKIILADPFGSDPILVTGSANYSNNSTTTNDENSLIIRGDFAVADIYVTEFMRMFEQYHYRASVAAAQKKAGAPAKGKAAKNAKGTGDTLSLKEDDTWTDPFFTAGSIKELDRRMFAGTLT